MDKPRPFPAACLFLLLIAFLAPALESSAAVTTPKQEFGFDIGEDYRLANYAQLASYWKKLEAESDRVRLFDIGKSAEGQTILMAVVTSPRNHARLERYKEISRRLALAENLTDAAARRLAAEGRAVVWIDGGLHASETLGSQQLIELVYRLAAGNDAETLRILDDVILLANCPNPDGLDLVAEWYMREPDLQQRSLSGLPRLYQKYVGHDNNRDFYMVTQPETEAVARILYREWFPQIVFNQHQSGPAGTVLFAPPFRDPIHYDFDPLIAPGIELVSSAMHNRFITENKPGATMRSGANYSTWYSGGLRTTAYYHNMIGILTETIGNPTPMDIPFLPRRLLASADLPYPVTPRTWRFRQSVDYMITADLAILDAASKHREDFLYRIYRMGRNSIERGSRDHWTVHPRDVEQAEKALAADKIPLAGMGRFRGFPLKHYESFSDPAKRDPRGFIIPSDQADFPTAQKFVNTLIKNGVAVLRATKDFSVGGKEYPTGSLIVKCSQAFRPHVLSQFEPQNYPHDFQYPGGPPIAPYDSAGWTLAFQMGIRFDRILEGFDGPFKKVSGLIQPGPGKIIEPDNARVPAAGYLLSHRVNDAVAAANSLLASGEDVYWLKDSLTVGGRLFEPGAVYVPAKPTTRMAMEALARERGLEILTLSSPPPGKAFRINRPRIGLWDTYGGSMPSGWVRWILEQYGFPYRLIFARELDASGLREKFDVIIFVGGAIPRPRGEVEDEGERYWREMARIDPARVPEEYRFMLGSVTEDKTIPQILKFMEEGGTVLAIGRSTSLASHAGLPLKDALVDISPDGSEKPLGREKYYIPGSILRVRVDPSEPLGFGLQERTDVVFSNSPVFRVSPGAALQGIKTIAWFEGKEHLRSGWAWGQAYLDGGAAVIEAPYGRGRLFLFGPEITFRAQPHGTFKFLFNAVFLSTASEETIAPGTE
ncbi:MAG: peptidase [Candidatus Aminicenantes bacterium]|nr:peptidase [Candidatus Aminicenantes bacterium]